MMGEGRKADRSRYSFGAVTAWVVLALMLLFAGLSVALIALGGQAYKAILRAADENARLRASVGYVVGRVRAFDAENAICIEQATLEGEAVDVLVLGETIDGEAYETRIYCAGGKLREQFVAAEATLESAEDGEAIAELMRFEAAQTPGMIEMRFVHPDGNEDTVHAVLHSGQEGAI